MRKVTRSLFQEEDDEEMVCSALHQHIHQQTNGLLNCISMEQYLMTLMKSLLMRNKHSYFFILIIMSEFFYFLVVYVV